MLSGTSQYVACNVSWCTLHALRAWTVRAIGAEYYVGNCHKWFCAPRGSAFLVVLAPNQAPVRPLIKSHGSDAGFTSAFIWDGNRDYSPTLALLTVMRAWAKLGAPAVLARNHALVMEAGRQLARRWKTRLLAPEEFIGSMCLVGLPSACSPGVASGEAAQPAHAKHVQDKLFHEFRIEVSRNAFVTAARPPGLVSVNCKTITTIIHGIWHSRYNIQVPVKVVNDALWVRISAHMYNELAQYELVGSAIDQMASSCPSEPTVCMRGGGCV